MVQKKKEVNIKNREETISLSSRVSAVVQIKATRKILGAFECVDGGWLSFIKYSGGVHFNLLSLS